MVIRHIGTLLLKSFGYLPVISKIPGNERNHRVSITEIDATKWIQKTYLVFHHKTAEEPTSCISIPRVERRPTRHILLII